MDVEGMKENLTQGKGVLNEKNGFRVVGHGGKDDVDHYEIKGDNLKGNRGRPPKDQTWRVVGKEDSVD